MYISVPHHKGPPTWQGCPSSFPSNTHTHRHAFEELPYKCFRATHVYEQPFPQASWLVPEHGGTNITGQGRDMGPWSRDMRLWFLEVALFFGGFGRKTKGTRKGSLGRCPYGVLGSAAVIPRSKLVGCEPKVGNHRCHCLFFSHNQRGCVKDATLPSYILGFNNAHACTSILGQKVRSAQGLAWNCLVIPGSFGFSRPSLISSLGTTKPEAWNIGIGLFSSALLSSPKFLPLGMIVLRELKENPLQELGWSWGANRRPPERSRNWGGTRLGSLRSIWFDRKGIFRATFDGSGWVIHSNM